MTQYRHRKLCNNLRSQGFLPIDEFLKRVEEKRQCTITIHEELEDGPDNSGTSQGRTDCAQSRINDCGSPDLGLSLPSVADSSSCASVHVLQDKAECSVWEEARPDWEARLVQGAHPDWEAHLVQETHLVQDV